MFMYKACLPLSPKTHVLTFDPPQLYHVVVIKQGCDGTYDDSSQRGFRNVVEHWHEIGQREQHDHT